MNPVQYSKFTIKQIRILSIKPFAPFFTALAAVAITARWDKVGGDRRTTFMAWSDVI